MKKWLGGPVSATEHIRVDDGSQVVVLGDLHGRLDGASCAERGHAASTVLSVDNIFAEISAHIAKTDPKSFVDVHLELPFAPRGVVKYSQFSTPAKPEDGYLFYDTYKRLVHADCLDNDAKMKKLCRWSNLRFHYDDVRSISPELTKFHAILELARHIVHMWEESIVGAEQPGEAIALFKYAIAFNSLTNYPGRKVADVVSDFKGWKISSADVLTRDSRVQKEIAQVSDTRIVKVIRRWMGQVEEEAVDWKNFSSLLQQIVTLVRTLPNGLVVVDEAKKSFDINLKAASPATLTLATKTLTTWMTDLRAEQMRLLDAVALLQDIYMLARMFKVGWSRPIRAIVFVGEAHARRLRAALNDAHFKTVRNVGYTTQSIERIDADKLPAQCLALDQIGWPWFAEQKSQLTPVTPIAAATITFASKPLTFNGGGASGYPTYRPIYLSDVQPPLHALPRFVMIHTSQWKENQRK